MKAITLILFISSLFIISCGKARTGTFVTSSCQTQYCAATSATGVAGNYMSADQMMSLSLESGGGYSVQSGSSASSGTYTVSGNQIHFIGTGSDNYICSFAIQGNELQLSCPEASSTGSNGLSFATKVYYRQ